MYVSYQVLGLQRTGTNWLKELIQHNFYIKPVNEGFWKHLTPLGGKESYSKRFNQWKYKPQDLILENNILYIATSKELNLWLNSLRKNAEDFYLAQNETLRNNTDSAVKVYNAWHNWKKQQLSKTNFIYHDYIDWMNKWETYLLDIENKTGWKRKHKTFKDITWNVYGSKDFDKSKYIKG